MELVLGIYNNMQHFNTKVTTLSTLPVCAYSFMICACPEEHSPSPVGAGLLSRKKYRTHGGQRQKRREPVIVALLTSLFIFDTETSLDKKTLSWELRTCMAFPLLGEHPNSSEQDMGGKTLHKRV